MSSISRGYRHSVILSMTVNLEGALLSPAAPMSTKQSPSLQGWSKVISLMLRSQLSLRARNVEFHSSRIASSSVTMTSEVQSGAQGIPQRRFLICAQQALTFSHNLSAWGSSPSTDWSGYRRKREQDATKGSGQQAKKTKGHRAVKTTKGEKAARLPTKEGDTKKCTRGLVGTKARAAKVWDRTGHASATTPTVPSRRLGGDTPVLPPTRTPLLRPPSRPPADLR
jgi:hypothetical protein